MFEKMAVSFCRYFVRGVTLYRAFFWYGKITIQASILLFTIWSSLDATLTVTVFSAARYIWIFAVPGTGQKALCPRFVFRYVLIFFLNLIKTKTKTKSLLYKKICCYNFCLWLKQWIRKILNSPVLFFFFSRL